MEKFRKILRSICEILASIADLVRETTLAEHPSVGGVPFFISDFLKVNHMKSTNPNNSPNSQPYEIDQSIDQMKSTK